MAPQDDSSQAQLPSERSRDTRKALISCSSSFHSWDSSKRWLWRMALSGSSSHKLSLPFKKPQKPTSLDSLKMLSSVPFMPSALPLWRRTCSWLWDSVVPKDLMLKLRILIWSSYLIKISSTSSKSATAPRKEDTSLKLINRENSQETIQIFILINFVMTVKRWSRIMYQMSNTP